MLYEACIPSVHGPARQGSNEGYRNEWNYGPLQDFLLQSWYQNQDHEPFLSWMIPAACNGGRVAVTLFPNRYVILKAMICSNVKFNEGLTVHFAV